MDTALLRRRAEENLRAMELFSRLLSQDGPLFTAGEVDAFARDCAFPLEEAYFYLIASACGLEMDRNPEHRSFAARYLSLALQLRRADAYRQNPYYARVRFPEVRKNQWEMAHLAYAPFQIFPCGDTVLLPDGREIPPLGYFSERFSYPAVLENGREWMTVTPNEIETMRGPAERAFGHAAVFGLGLGYYAYLVSQKPGVSAVTVIERDGDAIALFQEQLLPQFPNREKIRIVQSDAFDYLEVPFASAGHDFAFVDLWHDVSDGLPMYLRLRKMEGRFPGIPFQYWIEQSMLVFLRSLFVDDCLAAAGRLDAYLPQNAEWEESLSLESIRRLAPHIDPKALR